MQKIKQTAKVFISTMIVTFFVGYFNIASAASIQVAPGEGISHVAKKAGCSDYYSANRWQSIASQNGNGNWMSYNAQLFPGQIVTVNCATNFTPAVQPVLRPVQPVVQQNVFVPQVSYDRGAMEQKIRNKFGANAWAALRVANCESSMNPSAIGDRNLFPSSYGLFQVRAFPERGTPAQLLNPDFNIDFAYRLSQGGTNWSHWTCKP